MAGVASLVNFRNLPTQSFNLPKVGEACEKFLKKSEE